MRQLPKRGPLPRQTTGRLQQETDHIVDAQDKKAEAAKRYGRARKARWFHPVITALGKLAGPGERCMLCSGNEPSQVEHFRPKAIFPELALTWENLLWVCGICNSAKGDRFPTGPDQTIINPLEENVWDYFFIDSKQGLRKRIKSWLQEPYQRDVADYFLNGPGRKERPFSRLFELIR
jgi:5-methylcytosine-specific restriction endonuclease McrA